MPLLSPTTPAATPIRDGARILLEPRLMPGDDTTRLYVLVWEDGTGGRLEVCAGPDPELQQWLGSSTALYHRVPFVDRRDDVPPPADHSCAWCPVEVRNLAAVAHNTHGAVTRALAGQADWLGARRKLHQLGEALERTTPAREAHFSAVSTTAADVARAHAGMPACPACGGRLERDARLTVGGRAPYRCQACGQLSIDDNEPAEHDGKGLQIP